MRENRIIFTIDYETWQPIPKGYKIDWKKDLLDNADKLMEIFESEGAKLTFMIEMGEYFWICENDIDMAHAIEKQIQDMILRGHDVQLHLHPNWMPECGVSKEGEEWAWNWEMASADTYPGNFCDLIKKSKLKLEEIVRAVKPNYEVIAYRAGAYRIQPFNVIYDSLKINNILIDTSVYRGGKSKDRGYNFNKCQYANKPYWCKKDDAQLESKKNEDIVEMPITTWGKGERLFLDNDEASLFAYRFLELHKEFFQYAQNFFVYIGHSKGNHDLEAIKRQIRVLKNYPNVCFSTMGEAKEEIRNNAYKNAKRIENSIEEVKNIMQYIYDLIEPGEGVDNDKIFSVLGKKKALCCGYAVTLCSILYQYGYKVKCITATAQNMPKGKGKKRLDTHELVELKLNGKRWILDPTTNRMFPYGINTLLRKPFLAQKRNSSDSRYKERDYNNYDTSFFYERVLYYTKKRVCRYRIGYESMLRYMKRVIYVYLFHEIPNKIRYYNIYGIFRKVTTKL